jgi:hypothetical protein
MEQALVLLAGAFRSRPGGNNRWCDHDTNKGESDQKVMQWESSVYGSI